MATHLLVDGYNLVGSAGMAPPAGSGRLEAARETLLKNLAGYRQRKGHAITVVFDGWQGGLGAEHREFQSGVEVVYSKRGERITALIERRAPMLLRLAMLLALCDKTTTVEVHHINAALAWVRYSVESVKFIFASAADEVKVAEGNDTSFGTGR